MANTSKVLVNSSFNGDFFPKKCGTVLNLFVVQLNTPQSRGVFIRGKLSNAESQRVCAVTVGPPDGKQIASLVLLIYGRLCLCAVGREKPESCSANMEGRRRLLLSLIFAACFYGNAAQTTGGCDYDYDLTSCIPAHMGSRQTCPCFHITSARNICNTSL